MSSLHADDIIAAPKDDVMVATRVDVSNTLMSSLEHKRDEEKHDTGFAVEWSVEEQYTLEMSLDKNKSDPSIMKYIRIASNLPEKTIRDVALRCRWTARKRRKQEEHYSGKKVSSRKDKSVESCPKLSLTSAQPFNIYVHILPRCSKSDKVDLTNPTHQMTLSSNFCSRILTLSIKSRPTCLHTCFKKILSSSTVRRATWQQPEMKWYSCLACPDFPYQSTRILLTACCLIQINICVHLMGWLNDVHLKQEPRSRGDSNCVVPGSSVDASNKDNDLDSA
ncbi:hypothetical protein QQ045_031636 [Rhodiola kirilowii]